MSTPTQGSGGHPKIKGSRVLFILMATDGVMDEQWKAWGLVVEGCYRIKRDRRARERDSSLVVKNG